MRPHSLQPKHVGHVWAARRTIRPCLLSAMSSTCHVGYSHCFTTTAWLLDYSLTPFGRYKVSSTKSAWRERPAFEAHLYPPRTIFWEDTSTAGGAETRGIFVCFTGGEHALSPSLTRNRCVCVLDPDQRLGALLERIMQCAIEMGEAGFESGQGALWDIMALLNVSAARGRATRLIAPSNTAPPVSEFRRAIRDYFQKHLAESISREDMARHLGFSVSAFAHRYQREIGEAPMKTLLRMRLQVVKSLLLKGCPLKVIAPQTGFCDEYHLSRTFARQEGITAREFRRRQQQEAGGGSQ
ncbi:MAG: AraC family transcriptional regulator [Kiritimatiellae bacterium]|nr:AraC family transcriptional regulator [Kiritimatiellia bacterium]